MVATSHVSVMISPGKSGAHTYRRDIPLTWIAQHEENLEREPCVFVAPARDGACVCIVAHVVDRIATLRFVEMSLEDMARFDIEPVETRALTEVIPQFRAVMEEIAGTRGGTYGAGKSKLGGMN